MKYHRLLIKCINPSKILERIVREADLEEFLSKFLAHFKETFMNTNPFETLSQVHYYRDIYIEDEATFNLYMELIKKCPKEIRQNSIIELRETSIYLSSEAVGLNIYDKEQEAIDKRKPNSSQYKGLIRFEVQVKRKHIYYMEKNYNISADLKSYWLKEVMNMYMNQWLGKVIYNADYYTIDRAKTIIKATYGDDTSEAIELIKFLIGISKKGFDETKRKYLRHNYKRYLGMLINLGINPILIPKNHKSKIRHLHRLFELNPDDGTREIKFDIVQHKKKECEEYGEIIGIKEIASIIGVGRNKAYEIMSSGEIKRLETGKPIMAYKEDVIRFSTEIYDKQHTTMCECRIHDDEIVRIKPIITNSNESVRERERRYLWAS
jgi:hypothetical protein